MLLSKSEANQIALEQYDSIHSFCCSRLNNPTDADDVTQEVFLLFQQKGDKLENRCLRAWLYSTAENKIREKYRENIRTQSLVSLDEDMPETADEPLTQLDETQTISGNDIDRAKKKILERLSDEERELFEMIYENHYNYSRVAQELDLSTKAVNVRAFRLRKKIRDMAEIAFMSIIFVFVKIAK